MQSRSARRSVPTPLPASAALRDGRADAPPARRTKGVTSWTLCLIRSASTLGLRAGSLLGCGAVRGAARNLGDRRRTSPGWWSSASVAALPPGAPHRARRRGRLPGAGCCRRAGTSACGAGSTGSSKVPLVVVPARARSRSSSPPTAARSRPSAMLGREVDCDDFQDARAFLERRRREGPPARRSSPRARTASTRRCSTVITPANAAAVRAAPRRAARCSSSRRTGSASSPCSTAGPIPAGDLAGPIGAGPRQLPARPGVHRRRRLPRPAGGGAALGLVEPQPVVRAGRADAR